MTWPTREEIALIVRRIWNDVPAFPIADAILARFEPWRPLNDAALESTRVLTDAEMFAKFLAARREDADLATLALPLARAALDCRAAWHTWNMHPQEGLANTRVAYMEAIARIQDMIDALPPAQRARLRGA